MAVLLIRYVRVSWREHGRGTVPRHVDSKTTLQSFNPHKIEMCLKKISQRHCQLQIKQMQARANSKQMAEPTASLSSFHF